MNTYLYKPKKKKLKCHRKINISHYFGAYKTYIVCTPPWTSLLCKLQVSSNNRTFIHFELPMHLLANTCQMSCFFLNGGFLLSTLPLNCDWSGTRQSLLNTQCLPLQSRTPAARRHRPLGDLLLHCQLTLTLSV